MELSPLKVYSKYRLSLLPLLKRVALLLAFGIGLSVTVGTLTYGVLASSQEATFKREYNAMANQLIKSAQVLLSSSSDVAQSVAEMYSTQFPDASPWPLVAVGRYSQVVSPLVAMLGAININHLPIVQPSQLADFESFAYDFYASDSEGFAGLGESPFGKGVYAINASQQRYHDTSGQTTHSQYNIITPIFQIANPHLNAIATMYNAHSERVRAQAIDAVTDCFYNPNDTDLAQCSTITDMLFLVQHQQQENPAAILYFPEAPANNRSLLAGLVAVVFTWDNVLQKILPFGRSSDHLYLVLKSRYTNGTCLNTVTYKVSGGTINLLGTGDLSDHQLQRFDRSGEVNSEVGTASTSVKYHLHIMPSNKLRWHYINDQPLMISVWISVSIFGVLILVILYDTLVHAKSLNDKISQDLRRVYLRWVSHEMRSPLNSAFLAITTLECERSSIVSPPLVPKDVNTVEPGSTDSLIQEIKLGVENSVTVLDDLLEYSFMDTWHAENQLLDMWELVETVSLSFSRSAESRGVSLSVQQCSPARGSSMTLSQEEEGESPIFRAMVRGDIAALSRALSSVLRTSLKDSSVADVIFVKVVVELPEDSTVPRVATCSPTTSRKTGSVGITIEHSCSMQHKKHSYTSSTDKTKFDVGQLRTDRDNSLALWMASSVIRSHRGTLNVLIENGKAVTDIQLPLAADTSAVSIPSSQNSQRNDSWDGIKRSSSFTTVRGVKLSPIGNDDSVPVQFAPDQNCESIDASYDSSVEKESSFTLKILVVDDVLSNRKILSALLKAKGHECSMAADGLECMELVEEGSLPGHKQFDAICMDYEMPNCNGPEATRRLRELGYYIPVVGVTGNVLPVDMAFFKAQGAMDVLTKPVHVDTLQEVLQRCCRSGNGSP